MSTPLRVLLVEDSEDDAELLLRELRKGGYQPEHRRVENDGDLQSALEREFWDVVITDHNLPGFSSEAALGTVRRSGLDIPVIIVSGSIGESIAVEAMKRGANDYIMKDNLTRLVPAIARELRETRNRVEHRRAQETIRHLSHHDALTGLSNRLDFELQVELAMRMSGQGVTHALLYLDLDQFKIINDTCGHEAGDELLRQLAMLLHGPIRDVDTIARLGGDEFGVLLLNCSLPQAQQIAEHMLQIVTNFRFSWKGSSFAIGASIGLVSLDDSRLTLSDVLRMADLACYAAKDKGRNRIHVYRADDAELVQRHGEMQWITRLNRALEGNRFVLFRQCIESLSSRDDRHCELLLRLLDDEGQCILPGTFIPAAERYNLMPALDRWVVRNALATLRHDRQNICGGKQPTFFINLSGATLSDEQFADYVTQHLKASGLPPKLIGFEITETAVIANLASATRFIEQVRNLGCQVALDDFGSGLSSFSYLKSIPADYLKIDGSFIKDMLEDPMDNAIVEAVNRIGHVAGLKTIAEFVETDSIERRLREVGVDYVQGYAIQRPTRFSAGS